MEMKALSLILAVMLATGACGGEPTGCPAFTVERPRPYGGAVLSAKDFGLSEGSDTNAWPNAGKVDTHGIEGFRTEGGDPRREMKSEFRLPMRTARFARRRRYVDFGRKQLKVVINQNGQVSALVDTKTDLCPFWY